MLIDSNVMELTQDTVGTTVSTMSGVLENSKVKGWNHLRLHSFTCLAIDLAVSYRPWFLSMFSHHRG